MAWRVAGHLVQPEVGEILAPLPVTIGGRGERDRRRRHRHVQDVVDRGGDRAEPEQVGHALGSVHELGPAQEVSDVGLGQWWCRHVRSPHSSSAGPTRTLSDFSENARTPPSRAAFDRSVRTVPAAGQSSEAFDDAFLRWP